MTNSFLIGEVLNDLLANNEKLNEIIGNKIYPIVAAEGTKFPFIVYRRISNVSNGCKDGYYEDTVNFSITVLSESYIQSIEIAQLVRSLLEKRRIQADILEMTDCHVTSINEEYTDNTYIQTINFITKIN